MTARSLANLNYKIYPQAEFSSKPFFNISGYGANSYNGKIKSYNGDKIKIVYIKKKILFLYQIIQIHQLKSIALQLIISECLMDTEEKSIVNS